MRRIAAFFGSRGFFVATLLLLILGAGWTAIASLFPMAFDEEFHYGLIQIYATSLLPFGIEHTSDMAQFGPATADASYLFHYLMSFPYRILDAFGLPDMAIIILLRFLNIAMVIGGLVLLRRALREAGIGSVFTNVSLLLFTLLPVFVHLTAHINYDNLLFLVFAWCVLLIVRLTKQVKEGAPLAFNESAQLVAAVLIGMSIKYAFLPLALGIFIWILWLMGVAYRRHKQSISTQVRSYVSHWKKLRPRKRYVWLSLGLVSLFFVSHYATNTLTYGSPIPSCERVFSETECAAYGPWNRNKNMEARKSADFTPLSYPAYMTNEWLPGMTQRLTFAVAGKTNDFDTKLPIPPLVYLYVTLSVIGALCLLVQVFRRRVPWITWFALLLTGIYVSVLSFQLYGDYVDTAQPVAINGRYLLPLLPLLGAGMAFAMHGVLTKVHRGVLLAGAGIIIVAIALSGGGIGTYIVLADTDWFWPGFGQSTHASLQPLFERVVVPQRYD